MSSRDEIVERNVARLLSRAYRPVAPDAAFERELRRRVDERLSPVVAERAAIIHCADRELGRPPFRVLGLAWSTFAVAAAVLIAFGIWSLFATWRADVGERETVSSILGRGAVAVSERPGEWRALEPVDGTAHYTLAAHAAFETPSSARVVITAADGDALTLEANSGAECSVAGTQLAITLGRGALDASRAVAGEPWRFDFACDASHRRATIELAAGRLELDAAFTSGCARAKLSADGRAELAFESWRDALEPGGARELCASTLVPPPRADSARTGVGSEPDSVAVAQSATADVVGEVFDVASGQPLEDFRVVLAPLLTLPRPSQARSTDFEAAHGRFEIAEVEPGDYVVWVGAPGRAYFATAVVNLGEQPFELRADLPLGISLAGRVVARADGRPIEGALVLSENDVPASLTPLRVDDGAPLGIDVETTDASGRFQLDHLRSRATRLRVYAPGFAPAWVPCEGTSGDVEVSLTPAAKLVGRVENADGAPEAEHVVLVVPMDSTQYPVYWSQQTVTNDAGEFTVADLPALACVVVHLGNLREPSQWAPIPAVRYVTTVEGATQRADFVAPGRGARLFGRVLDGAGTALAGRVLTLVPAGSGPGDPTRWRMASVDAEGRYDLGGLDAGSYELYLSLRAPMEVLFQTEVGLDRDQERELDVHTGSAVLRGRAVGEPDRTPVANVVWILNRRVDGESRFAARVLGDSDGAFEVPLLGDGEYELTALPQDGVHAMASSGVVKVAGGVAPEPIELALGFGLRVAVVVRAVDGTAATGATVHVVDERGHPLELLETQRTDSQGRIEFVGLPAGTYHVSARLGELATDEFTLDLVPGAASPVVELALAHARR